MLKIKPSILISLGLFLGIGAWLYSGVDNQEAKANNQTTDTSEVTEEEDGLPSYQTSVRFIESTAINHASSLTITAQTQYSRSAILKAETYGRVMKLDIEEADAIAKGKTIAQLEIEDRGAQIKRAEAVLKQRSIEFEAAKKLAQKGFNSQIKRAESEANLAIARADLKQAETNYQNLTIRAPFDAVVHEKHIEIGDYVKSGDPIATIVDLDPIHIIAYVAEKEIDSIQAGSLAKATLINGQVIEGLVSHILPVALETTRSFEVKIEVPNEDGKILSGLTAGIELPLGYGKAHLLSPALLTLNNAGQIGIKTVSADNVVEFNPVTIIEDTAEGVWVSGLAETARIIAVGQEFVSVGATVTATLIDEASLESDS